jgi:hypothetical protein
LAQAERLAQSSEGQFNQIEKDYVQACGEFRDRGENERKFREALQGALVVAQQAVAAAGSGSREKSSGRTHFHIHVYEAELPLAAEADPKTYRAQLTVPGWGKFYPPTRIRIDHARLDSQAADPTGYGKSLGEMVFAPSALGPAYEAVLAQAEGAGDEFRVSVQLEAPELHAVRWERLHHRVEGEWIPLGSTATTPFSRYVFSQKGFGTLPPLIESPVRVLVVIADPAGLEKFELARIPRCERAALKAVFDGLKGVVEPTYLESDTSRLPTLPELRRTLAEKFHIVHFHAHGALESKKVALYLEGENKKVHRVTAAEVVESFSGLAQSPRVCFFVACESGAQASSATGEGDSQAISHARTDNLLPLGHLPLGHSLVAVGRVPAVVAMTERVTMVTARLFADQFYRRLLDHGEIDLALNEARASIRDRWDWSVPVLFSGLADNRIFSCPSNRNDEAGE